MTHSVFLIIIKKSHSMKNYVITNSHQIHMLQYLYDEYLE